MPDLNLLITLDVLLAEGSVARAAQRANCDGNDCNFLDCFHDESPCQKYGCCFCSKWKMNACSNRIFHE